MFVSNPLSMSVKKSWLTSRIFDGITDVFTNNFKPEVLATYSIYSYFWADFLKTN